MPFPAAPSTRASRSEQALINTKVGSAGMGGVGAVQIISTMLRRLPIPTDTILAARTLHKCTTIRAYTFKARLPTVLAVLIHLAYFLLTWAVDTNVESRAVPIPDAHLLCRGRQHTKCSRELETTNTLAIPALLPSRTSDILARISNTYSIL